jgi:hypothetical protein
MGKFAVLQKKKENVLFDLDLFSDLGYTLI